MVYLLLAGLVLLLINLVVAKCVHLFPTVSTVNAKDSGDLHIDNVFRLHGPSSTIGSDHDPRYTAVFFFQEQFHRLGTKLSFSTANHPQTGGLTESVNRTVENVLRAFVHHKQDNWDKLLPLCEFSVNISYQSSTANTPYSFLFNLWHTS